MVILDPHERLLTGSSKGPGRSDHWRPPAGRYSKNPLTILKHLVEKGAVEINEFVRYSFPQKVCGLPQVLRELQNGKGAPLPFGSTDQGSQTKGVGGANAQLDQYRSPETSGLPS